MAASEALVPVEQITRAILVLRGHKVLLDSELAALYGVANKRLNEQVRRNRERFPADFMFQLSAAEAAALRSQFATLESGRGRHRKYLPYAFTEHGAIMAATILHSPRAFEMSIYVVRALYFGTGAAILHYGLDNVLWPRLTPSGPLPQPTYASLADGTGSIVRAVGPDTGRCVVFSLGHSGGFQRYARDLFPPLNSAGFQVWWYDYATLVSPEQPTDQTTSCAGYLYYAKGVWGVMPHSMYRVPFTFQ